eukprot:sb/3465407/
MDEDPMVDDIKEDSTSATPPDTAPTSASMDTPETISPSVMLSGSVSPDNSAPSAPLAPDHIPPAVSPTREEGKEGGGKHPETESENTAPESENTAPEQQGTAPEESTAAPEKLPRLKTEVFDAAVMVPTIQLIPAQPDKMTLRPTAEPTKEPELVTRPTKEPEDQSKPDQSKQPEVLTTEQSKQPEVVTTGQVKPKKAPRGAGERPLKECQICNYTTFSGSKMREHNMTHENLRPFKCELCDYSANKKFNLQAHIRRVHQKERSFKCDECGEAYFAKRDLESHIRHFHTGEKPFKCKFCDFRSYRRCTVVDHMITHDDTKEYGCEICPTRFKRRKEMLRHLRTVHSPKPGKRVYTPRGANRREIRTENLITPSELTELTDLAKIIASESLMIPESII